MYLVEMCESVDIKKRHAHSVVSKLLDCALKADHLYNAYESEL